MFHTQRFPFKTRHVLAYFLLLLLTGKGHAQEKNVTILYTNDIESVYEPIEAFWDDDINFIGGIPYLTTRIKQMRQQEPGSFLFDAGDIFTGALAAATEGKLAFDLYCSMEYDAIALGNHEFEYGWQKLAHTKQRACFPVLNSNIFYRGTDINLCQSYAIVEKNDVRIGLIGVMGLEAFKNTIYTANREGLEARDPYPIVQKLVNELRDEVDIIVLLTHQNQSAPMQSDKEADPAVQRGFAEDYEMAGKIQGVDIIIGGHSDNGLWQPVKHPETGTFVCLTFGQGKYLGYLNLTIDAESKSVSLNEGKLIPVNADSLTPDTKVAQLITKARNDHPELTEVIGYIDRPAFRKYYQESTLSNLMADILKSVSKADIGLVNPGSMRADLNAGEITVEEIKNIYPFVDPFHVVEINGRSLLDLVEYSCQLTYGLAQFSGVKLTYDSQHPAGKRVIEVQVNGKPLELNANYTIACSAFLANGGDGFSMLKQGKKIRISDLKMIDHMLQFIRSTKQFTCPNLGRQIDVAKKI
ncbi:MAG: bifunctional metallophosphatase/5'-nucleotidase [Deferribacteres bacterium]|nr:bifunctional metallophosphatase/5'-nucleotidase [candidate division KSB1 bacterium]MCB9500673.1 bifunctional metallophosphatase/5'-nucleotidase [Deferribacteres bacterium]